MIHAEKLLYQISDLALSTLSKHSQGEQGTHNTYICVIYYSICFIPISDYRLVIITSDEKEEMSHFISKLHLYRRPFMTRIENNEFRNYLAIKATQQVQSAYSSAVPASVVDYEKCVVQVGFKALFMLFSVPYSSRVRIVSSDRSGMGKSLYIKRLAQNLAMNLSRTEEAVHVTIPLHGPLVTPDTVLRLFKDHFKNQTCCIYHIDISPSVRICIFW